ncbi:MULTISPECIES: Lrp/AsnC family transcriptional regulator [Silvimonas]|uniref:Lrp/AsnC family transcriptional regulator n=1 Tax=Silvimonas TaxID=300264 RepID=UPI0024B3ADE3|nr:MULTISPECIES: Lrp/AsnC family transcriptional regulator [Silvimonas]MDR3430027.1 Lrp/AsnC family transcriptional regulator [Silvimonas sp.]
MLDKFDYLILAELQRDARASHQSLSQQVPLSPSQIGRRIQRMEETGVIRGYRVALDPELLGLSVQAFVSVILERHGEAAIREFAAAVQAMPEVLEGHGITGDADYLLRVIVPDLPALSRFVMHKLTGLPGVRSVKSSVALDPVKRTATLPLPMPVSKA